MKSRRAAQGLGVAILLALGIGLVSCAATMHSRGAHQYLSLNDDKICVNGPAHMQGKSVKVTWEGSSGSVGCEIATIPTEGLCPPPGTVDAHGEVVNCPPDDDGHIDHQGDASDGASGNGPGALDKVLTFRFFGLPIEIDMNEGYLEYDIEIRATSRSGARRIRDGILAQARFGLAGFQSEMPGVYVIHYLIHAQIHNSDVLFTLANNKAFQSLNLSVNDIADYRTLSDAVLMKRNGWYLAGVAVALSDLNYGFDPLQTYVNDYRIDFRPVGSPTTTLEGGWGYRP